MSIINIAPATRAGAHLLIGIYGESESGKTRTALRLGRGLVGPKGLLGVLDTEAGRARLHASAIPGGFDVGELSPPFTGQRYLQAIRQFQVAGYGALVTDSFSHSWIGEGGVLDQAEATGRQGLLKWQQPKSQYRRLVQGLLTTRMHIILCSRAKRPLVETPDKKLEYGPLKPIQSADLVYELTVLIEMQGRGRFQLMKCPYDIRPFFEVDLIDESVGQKIAQWVAGGPAINADLEALRLDAQRAAEQGVDAFRLFWKDVSRDRRGALQDQLPNLQSIAQTADEERARAEQHADDQRDLDDPFKGPPVEIKPAQDLDRMLDEQASREAQ